MPSQLEKTLADQCGAVLLGSKPAALFTLGLAAGETEAAAALLEESGITTLIVCRLKARAMVLAFRPGLLQQALCHPVAQKWLRRLGYPSGNSLSAMLAHLRARFAQNEGFPHEIGFFLGYPPCDVVGFIIHGGKRYKHCCLWKVYGDVEKAKNLCDAFNQCRRICRQHMDAGGRLKALPELVAVKKAG